MYYLYNQVTEMTPMERMMAALRGEKPDRVPVHIYPRFAPLEYLGLKFLQTWEVPDLYVKAQILGQERFQYDCVIDYDMMGPVEEALGTVLKYPEDDVPMVKEPAIRSKEDTRKINWKIDPRKDGNMPKVLYVIRRLKEELTKRGGGKQHVPIMTWGSCPSRTVGCLLGFQKWFTTVVRDPAWAQELMELALDPWLEMVKAEVEAGADLVWVNDPVSSADCISRAVYEKLTQPMERKFIEAIRKETGLPVVFHPCGNWHDRLDLIAQNQADCYFLGPMDIRLCVERITEQNRAGRARAKAINGNIGATTLTSTDKKVPVPYATTLDAGTPDTIEAECREIIQVVEGSGLRSILGPNCWTPQGVPFVNIDTVVYAARKHGRLS
ncbi:MAG: uroporphyrinogen decarboxylase family protein [Acidobacteriia bacterium]|nr:uroporphyrinogen decarboxylase family protein [Terriglobia bacterium]